MAPKTALEKTINYHMNLCQRLPNDVRSQFIGQLVSNLQLYLDSKRNHATDDIRAVIETAFYELSNTKNYSNVYVNEMLDKYLRSYADVWFNPAFFDDIILTGHISDMKMAGLLLSEANDAHAVSNSRPVGQSVMDGNYAEILRLCMKVMVRYDLYQFIDKPERMIEDYSASVR